jgi:acetyl-CoA carboxylase alpha subunit
LIDEVVAEDSNPFITVESLHQAILASYVELAALSEKKLRARRQERIRNLRAFEIVQE